MLHRSLPPRDMQRASVTGKRFRAYRPRSRVAYVRLAFFIVFLAAFLFLKPDFGLFRHASEGLHASIPIDEELSSGGEEAHSIDDRLNHASHSIDSPLRDDSKLEANDEIHQRPSEPSFHISLRDRRTRHSIFHDQNLLIHNVHQSESEDSADLHNEGTDTEQDNLAEKRNGHKSTGRRSESDHHRDAQNVLQDFETQEAPSGVRNMSNESIGLAHHHVQADRVFDRNGQDDDAQNSEIQVDDSRADNARGADAAVEDARDRNVQNGYRRAEVDQANDDVDDDHFSDEKNNDVRAGGRLSDDAHTDDDQDDDIQVDNGQDDNAKMDTTQGSSAKTEVEQNDDAETIDRREEDPQTGTRLHHDTTIEHGVNDNAHAPHGLGDGVIGGKQGDVAEGGEDREDGEKAGEALGDETETGDGQKDDAQIGVGQAARGQANDGQDDDGQTEDDDSQADDGPGTDTQVLNRGKDDAQTDNEQSDELRSSIQTGLGQGNDAATGLGHGTDSHTGVGQSSDGQIGLSQDIGAQGREAQDDGIQKDAQDIGAPDKGAQDNGAQDNGVQDNDTQNNDVPDHDAQDKNTEIAQAGEPQSDQEKNNESTFQASTYLRQSNVAPLSPQNHFASPQFVRASNVAPISVHQQHVDRQPDQQTTLRKVAGQQYVQTENLQDDQTHSAHHNLHAAKAFPAPKQFGELQSHQLIIGNGATNAADETLQREYGKTPVKGVGLRPVSLAPGPDERAVRVQAGTHGQMDIQGNLAKYPDFPASTARNRDMAQDSDMSLNRPILASTGQKEYPNAYQSPNLPHPPPHSLRQSVSMADHADRPKDGLNAKSDSFNHSIDHQLSIQNGLKIANDMKRTPERNAAPQSQSYPLSTENGTGDLRSTAVYADEQTQRLGNSPVIQEDKRVDNAFA
eukprot:gb/GEZJ01002668.1/.p1 GENE.gb/GEZJ01002668.1/~~gb/GEZJ01002668.1/.p1  ORF type:complete len:907 (-),score=157.16 gb/GEZJ01002668.1/:6019-8739(-)